MIKSRVLFLFLVFSFTDAQEVIEIELTDGVIANGEFIGTYMGHVHLLDGDNLNHFDCNDIQTATKLGSVNTFEFDCNKNTVTKDILFPPQLNPMTGEWEVIIPDFLNPDKVRDSNTSTEELNTNLESKRKNFKKGTINNGLLNQSLDRNDSDNKLKNEGLYSLARKNDQNVTDNITEKELRKIIKKEVRKELRKVLPYEIKKHKESKQNRLFQNILLGCGAWFIFMLMLS